MVEEWAFACEGGSTDSNGDDRVWDGLNGEDGLLVEDEGGVNIT